MQPISIKILRRVLHRRYYPAADSSQPEFLSVRISSYQFVVDLSKRAILTDHEVVSGTYRRREITNFEVIYVLQLAF